MGNKKEINIKDAMNAGKGFDPEKLVAMFGPMIDNMIVAVPLEKFDEIKAKNPEAKIVPLMREDQIKYYETTLFLGLVNNMTEDLPEKFANMKNGIFKVAFGIAYTLEKDENNRNRFMSYVNKVVEYKGKIDDSKKTKVEPKVD